MPFDKRGPEVGPELWAYVCIFIDKPNDTPYKLTKVNFQRAVEFARPDFKHEELVFRNCLIVKDDRNLVFTDQRVVIYSVDCEELKQIMLKAQKFEAISIGIV